MFRLIQNTPVGGDCTCGYEVALDKEYTVREFVKTILEKKQGEWGYIGIHKEGSIFGDPSCQYGHGDITSGAFCIEILDMKIKGVAASGGWSRVDYTIVVAPPSCEPAPIKTPSIFDEFLDRELTSYEFGIMKLIILGFQRQGNERPTTNDLFHELIRLSNITLKHFPTMAYSTSAEYAIIEGAAKGEIIHGQVSAELL